jgi:hypothetical protein
MDERLGILEDEAFGPTMMHARGMSTIIKPSLCQSSVVVPRFFGT